VKKISTVAKRGNEIFKQQQLAIGLDLGDRTRRMKKDSPEATSRSESCCFVVIFPVSKMATLFLFESPNTTDEPFSVPIEARACGFCRLTWPIICEVCLDISRSYLMCPRRLLHQLRIFANSAVVAGPRNHRTVGRGGPLERVQFSQVFPESERYDRFPHARCSSQAGRLALQRPFG